MTILTDRYARAVDYARIAHAPQFRNARATVQDIENPDVGTEVFKRFTGGRDGSLGYYQSLAEIFNATGLPVARVLESTVGWMHELAGEAERRTLAASPV